MSITKEERRRAAVFVIGSLVLLGLSLGVVGVRRLARDDKRYRVVFSESVSGLEADSVVEYKGVPVGVVRDVRLVPGTLDKVEVELGIEPEVPIKTDTRARLRVRGITGMLQLELVGGTTAAADLKEHGYIQSSPSLLVTIEGALREMADVAKRIGASTGEAGEVLGDMRRSIGAVGSAARTFESSMALIGSQVDTNGRAVSELLDDPATRELPGELRETLAAFRDAAREMERAAASVTRISHQNRGQLRAAVDDLRRASADVRATARRVKSSPSSLLMGQPLQDKPPPDPLPGEEEE